MADDRIWWRKTCRLAGSVLIVWALLGVALQIFDVSPWIDNLSATSLGQLLAEFVAPVGVALALFFYAARQKRIDRRHGFGGD